MFVYLEKKKSQVQDLSLGSIIKRTKLKHNNVFANKLVNMRAQFKYIKYYMFICINVQKYIYINLKLDRISLPTYSYNTKLPFVVY